MITIIDFYADWCGPCRMQTPVIEELVEHFKDDQDITITTVDVDQNISMAQQYAVKSIPTIVILKDDVSVERVVGYTPKVKLLELIEDHRNG